MSAEDGADALDRIVWEIEDPDEVLARPEIVALPQARREEAERLARCTRLTRMIESALVGMPASEGRQLAAMCVAHVMEHWAHRYPNDARPRDALAVASRDATVDERAAAYLAARAAGADAFDASGEGLSICAVAYAAAYCCEMPFSAAKALSYASRWCEAERETELAWGRDQIRAARVRES